jgi:hypothetical protein
MDTFVFGLLVGHGSYRTERNSAGVAELVPTRLPIELNICSFAPPGESCYYSAESMMDLKHKLIDYSGKVADSDFERTFQQILFMAQKESELGVLYGDPQWAGTLNKRPEFSEICKKTTLYFEKKFTDDASLDITGIHIIRNNIGLPASTVLSFSDPTYRDMTNICNSFQSMGVKKLFLLDATCSNFLNPTGDGYLDDDRRTLFRLRRDMHRVPSIGSGRTKTKKKKDNKKKNHKNKRITNNQNKMIIQKTRKDCNKKKH